MWIEMMELWAASRPELEEKPGAEGRGAAKRPSSKPRIPERSRSGAGVELDPERNRSGVEWSGPEPEPSGIPLAPCPWGKLRVPR